MAENEKKLTEQEEKQAEDGKMLDMDEMENVTGGENPFAGYSRVPSQPYETKNLKGVK